MCTWPQVSMSMAGVQKDRKCIIGSIETICASKIMMLSIKHRASVFILAAAVVMQLCMNISR